MASNEGIAEPSGKRSKKAKTANKTEQAQCPPMSGILLSSSASTLTGPLATLPFEILVMIVQELLADDWQGGKVGTFSAK